MKNINIFIFVLITFSVFYSGCTPPKEGSVISDCVTCYVRNSSGQVVNSQVLCNQNSIDNFYANNSADGYTVDCQ